MDVQIWFGSATASRKARASSNPGVDQIAVTIADSATGSGEPASAVKLATSQGGLDSATAGASLNIGTQVLSGSGNAVSFWVRIDDATLATGAYTDLSLSASIVEDPV